VILAALWGCLERDLLLVWTASMRMFVAVYVVVSLLFRSDFYWFGSTSHTF